MQGESAPVQLCPRCGNFLLPTWSACPSCGFAVHPSESPPVRVPAWSPWQSRWWRRTRIGLVLTAIGLLMSWIPIVAAVAALFLSFGSTYLFLGAKAAGRRHEVAVVVAFLVLSIGGVILAMLVGSFLLQAYNAAQEGLPLSDLRDPAFLLVWASLPATVLVAAGFAVQVVLLVPSRQRRFLWIATAGLVAAAVLATWLADPELAALDARLTRGALVVDFVLRVSLYRMLEAPAYVALAILYLTTYWEAVPRPEGRAAPAPIS